MAQNYETNLLWVAAEGNIIDHENAGFWFKIVISESQNSLAYQFLRYDNASKQWQPEELSQSKGWSAYDVKTHGKRYIYFDNENQKLYRYRPTKDGIRCDLFQLNEDGINFITLQEEEKEQWLNQIKVEFPEKPNFEDLLQEKELKIVQENEEYFSYLPFKRQIIYHTNDAELAVWCVKKKQEGISLAKKLLKGLPITDDLINKLYEAALSQYPHFFQAKIFVGYQLFLNFLYQILKFDEEKIKVKNNRLWVRIFLDLTSDYKDHQSLPGDVLGIVDRRISMFQQEINNEIQNLATDPNLSDVNWNSIWEAALECSPSSSEIIAILKNHRKIDLLTFFPYLYDKDKCAMISTLFRCLDESEKVFLVNSILNEEIKYEYNGKPDIALIIGLSKLTVFCLENSIVSPELLIGLYRNWHVDITNRHVMYMDVIHLHKKLSSLIQTNYFSIRSYLKQLSQDKVAFNTQLQQHQKCAEMTKGRYSFAIFAYHFKLISDVDNMVIKGELSLRQDCKLAEVMPIALRYIDEQIIKLKDLQKSKDDINKRGAGQGFWEKSSTEIASEMTASNVLLAKLRDLYTDETLNNGNLVTHLSNIIFQVRKSHPDGFQKHGGNVVVNALRPSPKLEKFCQELISSAQQLVNPQKAINRNNQIL